MIISPHPGAGWVSSCDACHNVMMAVMTQSSLPWPGSWQGHSTRNQLEMQITTNTGQTGHRQRGGGPQHWAITLHSIHQPGHPRVESTSGDHRSVHYGPSDRETSPWLQDDSITLEFKWKHEKDEYRSFEKVKIKQIDELMKATQLLHHIDVDDCLPLGLDDDDYYDWVSSLLLSHDCHDW